MFKRKDSTKTQNLRRLLEMQGEDKEKIDAIIALTKENEKKDDKKILQSWISLVISVIALVVSILVAIFK